MISYSDIKLTYKGLLRRLNITHSSVSAEIQNLTKLEIQTGAEMFLYLNSCPRHNDYWVTLFKDIIKGSVQRSYLLLLNIFKKNKSTAKLIALKLIRKLESYIKSQTIHMDLINSDKNIYDLTKNISKVQGVKFFKLK